MYREPLPLSYGGSFIKDNSMSFDEFAARNSEDATDTLCELMAMFPGLEIVETENITVAE